MAACRLTRFTGARDWQQMPWRMGYPGDVLVVGGETYSRVLPQAARLVASHKAKQRALCIFASHYNPSPPILNLGALLTAILSEEKTMAGI
jgi:hypothetical protein